MFKKISTKIKTRKSITQDQLWDQGQHYHKGKVHEVRGEKTGLKMSEAGHFMVSDHILVLPLNLNLT